jgi:hypothetical protein
MVSGGHVRRAKLAKAYPLLRSIAISPDHVRQAILYHLDSNGIRAVSDVVQRGLENEQYKKEVKPIKKLLEPDATNLRFICRKRCCQKKKKNKIVQSGGSIAMLLSAVLPLLVNLIFGKK